MGALSRTAIIAAQDIRRQRVEVPEWDGYVFVQVMTAAERNAFDQSVITIGADGKRVTSLDNFRLKLVGRCLVDDNGKLCFGPDELDDLAAKNGAVISRLADIALEFNGMAAGSVEDATKNSAPGPSASSPSASPPASAA